MVRPEHFGYNEETAGSNAFQKKVLLCEYQSIRQCALEEFEFFVKKLEDHDIEVMVFDSPKDRMSPDAVFPNNWISLHDDGRVVLYPMLAKNRRTERRPEIIDEIGKRFVVREIIDLTHEEEQGRILEGTGSVVFDHVNRFAFANESPRTNKHLFFDLCEKLGYQGVFFHAEDEHGKDIYHTNVLMTIGTGYAVICREAIVREDRDNVLNALYGNGLKVMEISYEQMGRFAGNMIELASRSGERYLVMSKSAFEVLTGEQRAFLENFATLLHADIKNIEAVGGGSARCMIAGIHLPRK